MSYSPFRPRPRPRYPDFQMGQMPDPSAMQFPDMEEPNTSLVKKPSIWDKIQRGVSEGFMPTPAGMEGLLSPEDMKVARRQGLISMAASLLGDGGPKTAENYVTTGQALGKAIQAGQQAGQGAMSTKMNVMQMQEAKAGLEGKQLELQKTKRLAGFRQSIIRAHPMPRGGDPNRMRDWIDEVLPLFIEGDGVVSDDETVARLTNIRSTMGGDKEKEKEPGTWVTVPGADGKPMRRYVTEGEAGQEGIPEYEKPPGRDQGATLLDEQRIFQRGNTVGDDYTKATARIAIAADQFRTMHAVAEDAKTGGPNGTGSPQSQIALVFAFMKTLDPTSVVRESEYATAANARGVPESIRQQYNKMLDGAFLTPAQIDGFLKSGRLTAKGWYRQQNAHRKTYDKRAKDWKVPHSVTNDFFEGLGLDDPEPKADKSLFPPRGK